MQFEYRGKTWLREGFWFPGLYDYIADTRQKLSQPLIVPEYATAGETERMQAISEKAKSNPYLNRAASNQQIRSLNAAFRNVHTVEYGEHPGLYNICLFASRRLAHTSPMVFLYSTTEKGYLYNAFALDHQDKVWIYISNQLLSEHGMLKDEELCYLIGHELGHAQCHHSTITRVHQNSSSDMEYSADRAGMIVCAEWIRAQHPEYSMEEIARLAVLYGASALQKIMSGAMHEPGTIKWTEFDYESIQEAVDGVFRGASRLTTSVGTHPHTKHRVMAMIHFSQSQLFYRCLGEDPGQYRDLYTDRQLQNIMAYQLVEG